MTILLLYSILAISFVILSWLLFRFKFVTISITSSIGIFFFLWISSVIIAANGGVARYGNGIYSFDSEFLTLFIVGISVGIFSVIAVLSSAYLPPSLRPPDLPQSRPTTFAKFGLLLAFLPVIVYFYILGQVPFLSGLVELLNDGMSISMMNKYRLEQSDYLAGRGRYFGQGYFLDWFSNILPIIFIVYSIRFKLSKFVRFCILMIPLLVVISTGKRWPFMLLVFLYLVVYINTSTFSLAKLLKSRRVIYSVASVFVVGLGLSFLQMRQSVGDSAYDIALTVLTEFVGRFNMTSGIAINTAVDHYPEQAPYLLGASWLNDIKAIMPGPGEPYSLVFYQIQTGYFGHTASPSLIGSFYVNFGLFGVLILSIVFAAGFSLIDIKMSRYNDVTTRVSYCFLIVLSLYTIQGDVVTFINISVEVMIAYIYCKIFFQTRQNGIVNKEYIRA